MYKKNSRFSILTPSGFEDFSGITRKVGSITKVILEGATLECSSNHKIMVGGVFVKAKNIKVGDNIMTENGLMVCKEVALNIREDYLYDPVNVGKEHVYFSNGIVSHNCQFLGTGDTFIDRETLGRLVNGINEEYTTAYNNRMRVWKEPQPGHEYILCADPSFGVERDSSAFHVICLNTGEQVAEFKSRSTKLKEFGQIIFEQAMSYNIAIVACERNTLGIILIQDLFDTLEYENLWFDEKGEPGVLLTKNGRDAVLEALQDALYLNKIKVNSKRTVDEITTFITTESGKVKADKDYFDDLVTSLAIGCLVYTNIELAGQIPIISSLKPTETPEYIPLLTSHAEDTQKKEFEEYRKWVLE